VIGVLARLAGEAVIVRVAGREAVTMRTKSLKHGGGEKLSAVRGDDTILRQRSI